MSELINVETFESISGDVVKLSIDDWSAEGQIVEVKRLRKDAEAEREPFSVLILVKQDQALEQQIFTLAHPALGELVVFLVPLGPKDDAMCYEAVFA